MNWKRADRWYAESDAGYRIVFSRVGATWVYLCYGPPRTGWRDALKVRYELGEQIPREREYLGRAVIAQSAREMCEAHYSQTGGQHA